MSTMQTSYAFSQALLPVGGTSNVDLLLRFRAEAASTSTARRPLNISLVIDRSASMAGPPLRNALQAAEALVDQLHEDDILSVVIYDDHVDTLLPPQAVTDKEAVKTTLRRVRPGGCTNLSGGWLQGCAHVKAGIGANPNERVNRVLLLTDGQANAGITNVDLLITTAQQKADEGIVTTTLGFGTGFNEDLLIGMARAAGGNFYFIQSTEDAADVFNIELQSLKSIAAQNLTARIEAAPGVEITEVLSSQRQEAGGTTAKLTLTLGDVYQDEDKLLALAIKVPAPTATGSLPLLSITYSFDAVAGNGVQKGQGSVAVAIPVGTIDEAALAEPPTDTILDISRIRIATAKDQAVELSDKGDSEAAVQLLQGVMESLRRQGLHERFEVAEELDQLEFFAQRLAQNRLDNNSRKEMRDQSFQARTRNRADLSLRGVGAGSAATLDKATEVGDGVELVCLKDGGKLRVKVVSDGYDASMNVQFPRAIRDEGIHYVAEKLEVSADGTFYRTVGAIKRLVRAGETDRYSYSSGTRPVKTGKAATGPASAADLEQTDSVGDGVLVQCVKDGSKLRARVVSDGYDPNWNMRFPRSVREDGMLYVADEVLTGPDGKSYIACGKIKRFVQTP